MDSVAARQAFVAMVEDRNTGIDLTRASLLIAAEEYPSINIEQYLERFGLIASAATRFLSSDLAPIDYLTRLNHFLYVDQGFSLDLRDPGEPRRCLLNEVLESRMGNELTLAIAYLEIARLLGMHVGAVTFPGSILVKVFFAGESMIVDPASGEILSLTQCAERLRDIYGPAAVWHDEYLAVADESAVLLRLLVTMKNAYLQQSDFQRALSCTERIIALKPEDPQELRDRARIYRALECVQGALRDYERLLQLTPHQIEREKIYHSIAELREQVAQLH